MKKIIFILLIFRLVNCQNHFTDNYPLKTGNIFVHYISSWTGPYSDNYYERMTVIKDSIINSKKYFLVKTYYINGTETDFYRIDTLSGNLLYYYTNACPPYFHEILIDSLWSKKQNVARSCALQIYCIDTSYFSIFGHYTQTKYFYDTYQSGPQSSIEHRHYAKGFGLTYSSTETSGPPMGGGTTDSLMGCVINGVLYGDTTMPNGIMRYGNKIPTSFSLSQNYPNPFNPATKIKFDIRPPLTPLLGKKWTGVVLKIFDILGREAATLVNEELKPGSYEYEWGASNFSSGVYFYKLTTTEFTETKKMVLLK